MKGDGCPDVSSCIYLKVFDMAGDGEYNRTHIFEGICDSQTPKEPPNALSPGIHTLVSLPTGRLCNQQSMAEVCCFLY